MYWKIESIPVSPESPNRTRRDTAARNIGLGLAFVGYYHIGESIGALAVVPVLVEEIERSYNAGFEAGRETINVQP